MILVLPCVDLNVHFISRLIMLLKISIRRQRKREKFFIRRKGSLHLIALSSRSFRDYPLLQRNHQHFLLDFVCSELTLTFRYVRVGGRKLIEQFAERLPSVIALVRSDVYARRDNDLTISETKMIGRGDSWFAKRIRQLAEVPNSAA